MMAGHGARLGICRVVVADDETIDGVGILFRGDFLGESSDTTFHSAVIRMLEEEALYGLETLLVEPRHAVAPGVDVLLGINECKRYPLDMTLAHLFGIFQR